MDAGRAADGLVVADIPLSMRESQEKNRPIGYFDQDGFCFSMDSLVPTRFSPPDVPLPRKRWSLDITTIGERVCVQKKFKNQSNDRSLRTLVWDALGLHFYTESAARIRLSELPCVPRLVSIDHRARIVAYEFIRGRTLRHRLAEKCDVLDRDFERNTSLTKMSPAERHDRENRLWRMHATVEDIRQLEQGLKSIIACGVVPIDLNLGNVIVGESTGKFYFIDFELAHLDSFPDFRRVRDATIRELGRSFGISLAL